MVFNFCFSEHMTEKRKIRYISQVIFWFFSMNPGNLPVNPRQEWAGILMVLFINEF